MPPSQPQRAPSNNDEAEKQSANQETPTFRQISELIVEWLVNLDCFIYMGLFILGMMVIVVSGFSGFFDTQRNTALICGILMGRVALGLVLIYYSRHTMHLRDKNQHVPITALVVLGSSLAIVYWAHVDALSFIEKAGEKWCDGTEIPRWPLYPWLWHRHAVLGSQSFGEGIGEVTILRWGL